MSDLDQSQKKVAQLNETLKKERSESQILKRKYEDMISEVKVSKEECQNIQANEDALVLSAWNIEKESQATLADFGKLQQGYQVLEVKRDNLRLSIKELNKEKGKLEDKVIEIEVQRTTMEGKS